MDLNTARARAGIISASVIVFFLGIILGRFGSKPRIEERERLVIQERSTDIRSSAYVGSSTSSTRTKTRWRIKESIQPDGTVNRETVAEQSIDAEARTDVKATEATVVDKSRDVVQEKERIVIPEQAKLGISLLAGADGFAQKNLLVAVHGDYRISGNFFISGQIQTRPLASGLGAMVGAGVAF